MQTGTVKRFNKIKGYTPINILDFWFNEITPKQWWEKSDEFDQLIVTRFGALLHAASRCELYEWRISAEGQLAEIIILDQFSRNIYRGKPESFSNDALALALAQCSVAAKSDCEMNTAERAFLYMPYMHSESLLIHENAVSLFSQPGMEMNLEFELKHKAIIDRFGRYPHRNDILGRLSTPEEHEFLKSPGSSF